MCVGRAALQALLVAHCAAQQEFQVLADGEVANSTLGKTPTAGARGHHLVRSASSRLVQDDEDASVDDESGTWVTALHVVREDVMRYDWAGWKNCNDYASNGDKKTKYYCARAKKIKITFVGRPRGVFEYTYHGKKSVKDLLTGAEHASGDLAHWQSAIGCYQPNCNKRGFHVDGTHRKCRFGIITNNEDDCATPDHNAGVGCSTIATGSHATCCWTNCEKQAFQTKIEIIPVTCDKSVCPEAKGHFPKKEDLPETCKGEKCTIEECCVTTTTTTTKAAEKSGASVRCQGLLMLLSPLALLMRW
mmetsp:Transcript_52276/g.97866  ORF Transcript_52276/g.97866 Transcript_52276/m.97866 type:complete len:304 (-) Transcript_52276:267-1178(-)